MFGYATPNIAAAAHILSTLPAIPLVNGTSTLTPKEPHPFDIEVEAGDQVPSRRMLGVGRTEVPPEIAEWLQVEQGASVVVRRRLQLVNDHPAVLSASYFPLWLAKGTRLESSGALPEGPDELIEGLGHRFVRGVEVFRARMPAPEEARILRLDPGIPVVRMRTSTMTPRGGRCRSLMTSTPGTSMSSRSSGASRKPALRNAESRAYERMAPGLG